MQPCRNVAQRRQCEFGGKFRGNRHVEQAGECGEGRFVPHDLQRALEQFRFQHRAAGDVQRVVRGAEAGQYLDQGFFRGGRQRRQRNALDLTLPASLLYATWVLTRRATLPIRLSGYTAGPAPAETLGASTDEVLTNLLGLTPDDLEGLRARRVI